MPYFIIGKLPVFLSWSRHKVLEDEALKDKDLAWRAASKVTGLAGNKSNKEKDALMYGTLLRKWMRDPEAFRSEWVRFDLFGEEARANVWDLLYDYCHFRGYAFLSDSRHPIDIITSSYKGESYQYPMGRKFVLNHHVTPARWWWRLTRRMRGRRVRVVVNSEEVTRLVGELANFEVHGESFVLKCGEDLDIQFVRPAAATQ